MGAPNVAVFRASSDPRIINNKKFLLLYLVGRTSINVILRCYKSCQYNSISILKKNSSFEDAKSCQHFFIN